MNTIDKPVWRTKDGDIEMSEMSEDHLQAAYESAERRFMKCENVATKMADNAMLFSEKLKQLEQEAHSRGIRLKSLTEKNTEKFGILRNRKRLLAVEE